MEFPIEAFRKVVDELCVERNNGSLWGFVFGKDTKIASWENEVERDTNYELGCQNGISKLVFFSDSFDEWVLKIPRHLDKDKNYCQIEADNYEKAVECGFDEFFAPTFFVEEYNGIPLYAQTRLECDSSLVEENFYKYAKDICDPNNYEDDESYDDVVCSTADNLDTDQQIIAVFGDSDEVYNLCDFCEEMEINDLHSANFGCLNGTLVMCDFSGF